MNITDPETTTAYTLLIKYLDYVTHWSKEELKKEHPTLVRLQQMDSLRRALHLTKSDIDWSITEGHTYTYNGKDHNRQQHLEPLSDLEYFASGEFLNDRPYQANQELVDWIITSLRQEVTCIREHYLNKPMDLHSLFANLLAFRKDIYKLTHPSPWGIFHSGQPEILFREELEGQFLEKMRQETLPIDKVLALLIDPLQRIVSTEELTVTFGYPNLDLDALDYDWYDDIF